MAAIAPVPTPAPAAATISPAASSTLTPPGASSVADAALNTFPSMVSTGSRRPSLADQKSMHSRTTIVIRLDTPCEQVCVNTLEPCLKVIRPCVDFLDCCTEPVRSCLWQCMNGDFFWKGVDYADNCENCPCTFTAVVSQCVGGAVGVFVAKPILATVEVACSVLSCSVCTTCVVLAPLDLCCGAAGCCCQECQKENCCLQCARGISILAKDLFTLSAGTCALCMIDLSCCCSIPCHYSARVIANDTKLRTKAIIEEKYLNDQEARKREYEVKDGSEKAKTDTASASVASARPHGRCYAVAKCTNGIGSCLYGHLTRCIAEEKRGRDVRQGRKPLSKRIVTCCRSSWLKCLSHIGGIAHWKKSLHGVHQRTASTLNLNTGEVMRVEGAAASPATLRPASAPHRESPNASGMNSQALANDDLALPPRDPTAPNTARDSSRRASLQPPGATTDMLALPPRDPTTPSLLPMGAAAAGNSAASSVSHPAAQ